MRQNGCKSSKDSVVIWSLAEGYSVQQEESSGEELIAPGQRDSAQVPLLLEMLRLSLWKTCAWLAAQKRGSSSDPPVQTLVSDEGP